MQNKNKWFAIYDKTEMAGVAEIYLYDEIDPFFGIGAKDFATELSAIKSDQIHVRINSPGGSVSDGLAIYNLLKAHPAKKTVFIDSLAASVASVIALAGDDVRMADSGFFMIHNPWTFAGGDAEDLRKIAGTLDKHRDVLAGIYSGKTGLPVSEIVAMMDAESWLKSGEAKEKGFIDSVFNAVEVSNKFKLESVFGSVPDSLKGGAVDIRGPAKIQGLTQQNKGDKDMTDNKDVKPVDTASPVKAETPPIEAKKEIAVPAPVSPPVVAVDHAANIVALAERHRMPSGFAVDAIRSGKPLDEVRGAILEHLAKSQPPVIGPSSIQVVQDSRDKFRNAARHGLFLRAGIKIDGKPAEGADQMASMSLLRIAEIACREAGHRTDGMSNEQVARAALGLKVRGIRAGANIAPSDLPGLFTETLERRLKESYYGFGTTYEQWTLSEPRSDFRMQNWIRFGGIPEFDRIPLGGEYKEFTFTESTGGWRIHKYGKKISVFWETIVNDEFSALLKIPQMFGVGAALLVDSQCYALLMDNSTTPDGVALFHADHNNIATTAGEPSRETIMEMRTMMRRQRADVGVNGDPTTAQIMDLKPKFVHVGLNQEEALLTLLNSPVALTDGSGGANTNSAIKNPVYNLGLTPISTPRLDGPDEDLTEWFMQADPAMFGGVTIGWLNNAKSPEIIEMEDQTIDAVSWKARLCFGATLDDHRPFVRNAGA